MQGAFIQSLTYQPPRLLGRQLLPLSSWHGLILEAAASPYLIGGIPKVDDMILGVWVCSHSYTEGWKAAIDTEAARKWGASVRKPLLANALMDFSDYVDASFCTPRYWSKGDSGQLKAPYWWHCATFAMRELRMTEAQAWDYPVARIACVQACEAERNGNKNLMSAEDIRGIEVLEADEMKARKTA